MSSLINDIHAEDVANYLNQNREFFHVFPNLLNELSIPHPTTDREISLIEHQLFQLREQRDELEIEINTLKDIAGENGLLLHKVYQFCYALMETQTNQEAVDKIYSVMHELFEVDEVSLMSWELPASSVHGINQLGVSQTWSEAMKNTLRIGKPVCGILENDWQNGLFATQNPVQSVCLIPLGFDRIWGVLALGSSSDRFQPDLGTYFLKVMGEMVASRLKHLF